MIAALLGMSLLLNPGPGADCAPYTEHGNTACHYVTHNVGPTDSLRIFRGNEGYNRGITSVGVKGKGQTDPCQLREITTVHYSSAPWLDTAFVPHRFGDFADIEVHLDVRLDYVDGPPECPTWPTDYVTVDTAATFPSGEWRLLGFIIYTSPGAWKPSGNVYWSDGGTVHPGAVRTLVMAEQQLQGGMWQSFRFPLLEAYKKFHIPPKGFRWEDATLSMSEAYVSTRGSTLEVSTRNFAVVGVPR